MHRTDVAHHLLPARRAGTARAAEADPNPVTSGLFVQAINEMIDSYGRRDAGLNRHVPEVVLFLLYAALLMTGAVVGLSSGLSGHRPSRGSSMKNSSKRSAE